jgi:predicted RNase H-like nuclease (RuvC/YqgF family)
MMTFESPAVEFLFWCIAGFIAILLVLVGYKIGTWIATARSASLLQAKEQDLFTAQKGFKQLYETELATLKGQNEQLTQQVQSLEAKVEDYRKKAAGLGGLFSSSSKKSDAMYALLLENEALEEALHRQNEKLNNERTDAVKESLRNTSYRRVLMSQLLNDNRIKEYVAEILNDEHRLPPPTQHAALPGEEAK